MSRPIKFRIFDKKNKRWLTSGSTSWAEVVDLGAWLDTARWAISQFTGTKDKNGREVWEDDIVNVNGKNHRIEWRGCGFCISGTEYGLDTIWFQGGEPVIIGNMLNNPELLKK